MKCKIQGFCFSFLEKLFLENRIPQTKHNVNIVIDGCDDTKLIVLKG